MYLLCCFSWLWAIFENRGLARTSEVFSTGRAWLLSQLGVYISVSADADLDIYLSGIAHPQNHKESSIAESCEWTLLVHSTTSSGLEQSPSLTSYDISRLFRQSEPGSPGWRLEAADFATWSSEWSLFKFRARLSLPPPILLFRVLSKRKIFKFWQRI